MSELILSSNGKIFKRKTANNIIDNVVTTNDDIEKMIEMAGYSYDPQQDIFVSTLNPWQRNVGYCRLYDEAAAPLGMIIDSEPIYFEYQEKKWMIGFWKGQYDLVTGGEIGIYKEAFDLSIPGFLSGVFYSSVSNNELLQMSFILKKNGTKLFTREGEHWWLTGFVLGEFSEPQDLTMEISLKLANSEMREAFISGLRKAGYSDQEFTVSGNVVDLFFDTPHSKQPYSRTKETDKLIQKKNKYLCDKFQEITRDHNNLPAKLKATEERAPELYKHIFNSGKNKSLYEAVTVIIRTGTFLISNVSGKSSKPEK